VSVFVGFLDWTLYCSLARENGTHCSIEKHLENAPQGVSFFIPHSGAIGLRGNFISMKLQSLQTGWPRRFD
jgi:hypothetical protein